MNKFLVLLLLVVSTIIGVKAQSNTTEELARKNPEALSLFFYNNTLRMLNQKDSKEFDELIKDIEKMKMLMISKDKNFGAPEYKKLVAGYKTESFEEIMTSRHEGKNFDVFIKEKNGDTKGMLVLVNDSTNLYVMDIVGKIALDKVTNFYKVLDESSDIGSKIKSFTDKAEKKIND